MKKNAMEVKSFLISLDERLIYQRVRVIELTIHLRLSDSTSTLFHIFFMVIDRLKGKIRGDFLQRCMIPLSYL